jgi:ribosomal protein L28
MSNEQVRKIIEAAPLMRQLLDAVEEEALKRFKSGVSIEGLKAVNGRGSQVWTFNEDETADKLKKMGIPVGEIYETKLISPAKAKKATWVKRNRGEETKMQLSARQLKTLEAEYITKVAGKLTIVSESDSRPAIVLDAAPLFSAVQEAPKEPSLPAWLS